MKKHLEKKPKSYLIYPPEVSSTPQPYEKIFDFSMKAVSRFLLEKIYGKKYLKYLAHNGPDYPFELFKDPKTGEMRVHNGNVIKLVRVKGKKQDTSPGTFMFPENREQASDFWVSIGYGIACLVTCFTYYAPSLKLQAGGKMIADQSRLASYEIAFCLKRKNNTDALILYNLVIKKHTWNRTSNRCLKT